LKKLQSASDDSLMASCVNLEVSLTHEKQLDVVGQDQIVSDIDFDRKS